MVHPRLYWGEVGNDLTTPLIELPISRNHQHGGWSGQTPFFAGTASPITASRTYEIFNQNGWGRSLHFLAAWFLVVSGAIYLLLGLLGGHFRRHLVPARRSSSPAQIWREVRRSPAAADPGGDRRPGLRPAAAGHVCGNRVRDAAADGAHRPDDVAGRHRRVSVPVDVFGGHQSARTIHFFAFVASMLFLVVHLVMVVKSGFRRQMRAMTIGRTP